MKIASAVSLTIVSAESVDEARDDDLELIYSSGGVSSEGVETGKLSGGLAIVPETVSDVKGLTGKVGGVGSSGE